MMANLGILDWALVLGVCALGWFLAVRFKTKYSVSRRDFFAVSFYVAGLASIIIGAYHILRGLLLLTP